MDLAAEVLETARHLVWMASMPMAVDHAKLRERELIASDPMYAVLPDLIREERQRLKTANPTTARLAR